MPSVSRGFGRGGVEGGGGQDDGDPADDAGECRAVPRGAGRVVGCRRPGRVRGGRRVTAMACRSASVRMMRHWVPGQRRAREARRRASGAVMGPMRPRVPGASVVPVKVAQGRVRSSSPPGGGRPGGAAGCGRCRVAPVPAGGGGGRAGGGDVRGDGRPGPLDAGAGVVVVEGVAAGGVPVGVAGRRGAGVAVAVVFGEVGVGERRDVGPGVGGRGGLGSGRGAASLAGRPPVRPAAAGRGPAGRRGPAAAGRGGWPRAAAGRWPRGGLAAGPRRPARGWPGVGAGVAGAGSPGGVQPSSSSPGGGSASGGRRAAAGSAGRVSRILPTRTWARRKWIPPPAPAAFIALGDRGRSGRTPAAASGAGRQYADQRRGAVVVGVQADLRAPLGGLPAVLGALGVGGDHRPADRGVQLPVGQVPGAGDDLVLHGLRGGVGQRDDGLGDDLGPVGVDPARPPAPRRWPGSRHRRATARPAQASAPTPGQGQLEGRPGRRRRR